VTADTDLLRRTHRDGPFIHSCAALFCYLLTTAVVLVGVLVSFDLPNQAPVSINLADVTARFMGRNGRDYVLLAREGYRYEPDTPSNVAFFPAYPLAARAVAWLTGLSVEAALLVVSNTCLIGAFVLLGAYVRRRWPDEDPKLVYFALLALGLWPTSMFFRMMHSESLMLVTAIGAMYAIERGARPSLVALLVGFGTACRPVGIALLGPFALYLWQRRGNGTEGRGRRLVHALMLMPLACWGIGAFMLFQYSQFGDPLAFAQTQQFWGLRPGTSHLEQWLRAASLEPLWSVYAPSSPAYWAKQDVIQSPLFSLSFANPIYFVIAAMLVVIGWKKSWLNRPEVLLSALLLAIPYVTHSYRFLMLSQGRFAAVVFPAYLVVAFLALRAPRILVAAAALFAAFLLAAYSALFAAWYRVI
jgi:hypothetical protein